MDKEFVKHITVAPDNHLVAEFQMFVEGSPLVQMQAYPHLKASLKAMVASIVAVAETETFQTLADKIATEADARKKLTEAVNDNIAHVDAEASLPELTAVIADKSNYPYRIFDGVKFYQYSGELLPVDTLPPLTDCNYLFSQCYTLKEVPPLKTSEATGMVEMFRECRSLETIPPIDTSKVADAGMMFYGCNNLKELPQLNLSSLENMERMFELCSAVVSISLTGEPKPTNMTRAFSGCSNLQSLPNLDTSNVTSFTEAFSGCTSLTSIPQIDCSSAGSIGYILYGCTKLQSARFDNTSNVTSAVCSFYNCTALTEISEMDLTRATSVDSIFYNCGKLVSIPPSLVNLPNCTNMLRSFSRCRALESLPKMITPKVINMEWLFQYCQKLTRIEEIDFASLQNWSGIFAAATSLTYMVVINLGMSSATSYSFEDAIVWGTGGDDNRQSVIDSLITYSYDRVAAGLSAVNIRLKSATFNLLTEEEIASITAKGYTLTSV